jgi:hypothetical protein
MCPLFGRLPEKRDLLIGIRVPRGPCRPEALQRGRGIRKARTVNSVNAQGDSE